MILSEFMVAQPQDMIVHVGAKFGSSYFFIGTPVDFFENAWELNDELKKKLAGCIEGRKKRINDMVLKLFGDELLEPNRNDDRRDLVKEIIHNISAEYSDFDYLRDWIDLEDRIVLETYDRKCMKDGIVALVEGNERGSYWDKEEWDIHQVCKNCQRTNTGNPVTEGDGWVIPQCKECMENDFCNLRRKRF